jgi:putative ABC transport system permease protein
MKLVSTARLMVLSIATVAILIAMVGVVNTVLMSVMERRREIGILKTMGAMPMDVFRLIWTETFIICAIGGLSGISFAFLLARATDVLARRILPYAPTGGLVAIDAGMAFTTLGIIVGVGLLSGVYPAWKAGRVRPLDSIRSDE